MEGGTAFSVPLARKLETYGFLAEVASEHGLWFNTCGCKDLRVKESGLFSVSCRNTRFLEERKEVATRNAGRRGQAPAGPLGLRAAPRS